jgi:hypothetical protein
MMEEAAFPAQLAVRGETVTYHPTVGDDAELKALFSGNAADLVEGEPAGTSDARTGTLRVLKTELASPDRDDKVTIRSSKWDVVTIDDLEYAWRLNIRRSVAVERGAGSFRQPRI